MNADYLYKLIISAMLFAGAIACSQEFEPNVGDNPVAVLNVLAEADSTLTASVTRSWKFGGEKPEVVQNDAQVLFTVNGNDMGEMRFDAETKKFMSDYVAREGDKIEVTAHTRHYGDAIGYAEVPRAVKLDSVSCAVVKTYDYDSFVVYPDGTIAYSEVLKFQYKLTFTDPADEENYYMISDDFDGSDEPLFGEHNTPLDAIFMEDEDFYVFTDRNINGKTYTLNIQSIWYRHGYGSLVDEVKLYSISKEFYLYLLSIYKKYTGFNGTLEEFGMAEPRNVYSNVNPGVGLVAARSCDAFIYDKTADIKHHFPGMLPDEDLR